MHLFSKRSVVLLILLVLAALALLAPQARGDVYVDAARGDDGNSGASWEDPFRTITRGVAAPDEVVRIAPGVYDAALGEVFPIAVQGPRTLIGEGGYAILDGDGASTALVRWLGGYYLSLAPRIRFERLWLRDAATGFDGVMSPGQVCKPVLSDVVLSDISGRGVDALLRATYFWEGLRWYEIEAERCRVHGCGTGFYIEDRSESGLDNGTFANIRLECRDSELFGNTWGIAAVASSGNLEGSAGVEVTRCRIHDNESGVGGGGGGVGIGVQDSVLASNGTAYWVGASYGGGALRGCTVVDGGTGVRGGLAPTSSLWLESCILFGNADDVSYGVDSATRCLIGDGDWEGENGNLCADPLFVAPEQGDYRLTFGSPCVDAGSGDRPDVVGALRDVDGDLDLERAPDIGALEFLPLSVRGKIALGAKVVVELWGPPGGTSTLYWAPTGLLETPRETPYGLWQLPRSRAGVLAIGSTAPGPPGTVTVAIPYDPRFLGSTLSLQALSTSPVAPTGLALTNAVTVDLARPARSLAP